MRSYKTIEPKRRTAREVIFLLAIAVALGLGLALASPTLGAGLHETLGGTISGTVTVIGGSPAGITVELRQRSNGGDDKVLATTSTDSGGNYSFSGQPTAPNDAFFYVKITGGKGTLSAWYSFPIIYLSGSDFTVPSVEMSDVQLLMPPGSTVSLPTSLQWQARRSGETYRLFIYAKGDLTKAVLDSGSLGMGTQFGLAAGSLPEGSYEGVVQVRDAVVGYGQSRAHFVFNIGSAPSAGQGQGQGSGLGVGGSPPPTTPPAGDTQPQQPQPTAAPAEPEAAPTATTAPAAHDTPVAPPQTDPEAPVQPTGPVAGADLKLDLSADRAQVKPGESIVYKIEVANNGTASAPAVVVTDNLPAGVVVNSSTTNSTVGSIAVQGNSVTVQIGDLPPDSKAIIQIPVSVGNDAGTNLSNQATAQYQGATAAINSNAFIAQVASPPASQPQQPPASNPQAPAQAQPQAPSGSQPAQPPASPPKNQPQSQPAEPAANPPASQPKAPAQKKADAPIPQTGGSFPLVLTLLILLVIVVARYLRGRSYRRI